MMEPRFDRSEPSRRSLSIAPVMTLLSRSTVSRDGQTRVRASILRLNRCPRLQHVPACRTLPKPGVEFVGCGLDVAALATNRHSFRCPSLDHGRRLAQKCRDLAPAG